nr:FlgD immunoglobulin-like domain containing protein [Kineosporia babensis]
MLGFTPNGDGKRDTWAPQFDTTEPLAEATLQIVSERSGNAIRTLRTTDTADGGIRDLVWDGKSSSGDKAAVGYYRWNLTARSASGAALTTATDGKKISGRIELGR